VQRITPARVIRHTRPSHAAGTIAGMKHTSQIHTTPQPEPASLREALRLRGITPTYWQPEPDEPPAPPPAVPGIEVRYLE
jgi:hypothetical protein